MKRFSVLMISGFALVGCFKGGDNGVPILSFLTNSRMVVLLKGTYASDNPLSAAEINNNRIFVDDDDSGISTLRSAGANACTPFVEPDCIPNRSDLPVWLDIGEIRLSTQQPGNDELLGIDSAEKSEDFWNVAADERQVYCSIPYTADPDLDNCKLGGLVNYQELTNGRGVVYPSRDIQDGIYYHVGIYVRAIATGWGILNSGLAQDRFDNSEIFGANLTPYIQYDPNIDEVTRQLLPPDWFPLHYSVGPGQNFTLVKDDATYNAIVLEIRFNMFENMMVHRFVNPSSQTITAVAFSDWRRPNADSLADRGANMGGNVLTRARFFYPDITQTLVIDGGTRSTRHYYSVYQLTEENKTDHLPFAATPVRDGASNSLSYMMPGTYVIQCRYDCRADGYPELTLTESAAFEIPLGPGLTVQNFPCGPATAIPGGATCTP